MIIYEYAGTNGRQSVLWKSGWRRPILDLLLWDDEATFSCWDLEDVLKGKTYQSSGGRSSRGGLVYDMHHDVEIVMLFKNEACTCLRELMAYKKDCDCSPFCTIYAVLHVSTSFSKVFSKVIVVNCI